MRESRTPTRRSRQLAPTLVVVLVVGAGAFYAGYRYGYTKAARERPQPAAAHPRPAARTADRPAAEDPHFQPRTVSALRGNFLENPGFESGPAGWKWLDWSSDWAPFEVAGGRVAAGTQAAHLAVRGNPGDKPTRVYGLVQELATAAFPSRISGRYFVERWDPGQARRAYTQAVIIAMRPKGDQPTMQLRYILEGVTEQPYNLSNARYVFVHRRALPPTGTWIDFSLDVREDYRRLWGEVPPDGTPFRVLFEARYDDKPPAGSVATDVWYDELFVGVP